MDDSGNAGLGGLHSPCWQDVLGLCEDARKCVDGVGARAMIEQARCRGEHRSAVLAELASGYAGIRRVS